MLYIYMGYALPIVWKESSEIIPRSLLLLLQDLARLIISIYN